MTMRRNSIIGCQSHSFFKVLGIQGTFGIFTFVYAKEDLTKNDIKSSHIV